MASIADGGEKCGGGAEREIYRGGSANSLKEMRMLAQLMAVAYLARRRPVGVKSSLERAK